MIDKHLIEMSFANSLDDFAEYVHRKQAYLKTLESEYNRDFEAETAETVINKTEWAKIKQLRNLQKEVAMLNTMVVYITSMDSIIRKEVAQEEYDYIKLLKERDTFEKQAGFNWELYKKVANSEYTLLKSLINVSKNLTV